MRFYGKSKEYKGNVVVERADWMAETYKENIDSFLGDLSKYKEGEANVQQVIAQAIWKKNKLLDEIFSLAAFAFQFSFVEKTRRHSPKLELEAEDVFKTLVEMYVNDPQTKDSLSRISSWQIHDTDYSIDRSDDYYDMPVVPMKIKKKVIQLINDPDLTSILPPSSPEPAITKISPEQEKAFGPPTSPEETWPQPIKENNIRVKFAK